MSEQPGTADAAPTLRNLIYEVLADYRMTNMGDEDGEPYSLVDLASNDGCTIETGREELRNLADHIATAIEEGKAP